MNLRAIGKTLLTFFIVFLILACFIYLEWCYETTYYEFCDYKELIQIEVDDYNQQIEELNADINDLLETNHSLNLELADTIEEYEYKVQQLEDENWELRYKAGFIYNEDIPLSIEYQYQVFESSIEFEVPQALILAVIQSEGGFIDNNYSTQYIGPMAVSTAMQNYLTDTIGLGSLYDFKENIRGGTYFLSYYYEKYHDWNMTLIAYNCGESIAKSQYFDKGAYYSTYSQKVLERMEEWEKVL